MLTLAWEGDEIKFHSMFLEPDRQEKAINILNEHTGNKILKKKHY